MGVGEENTNESGAVLNEAARLAIRYAETIHSRAVGTSAESIANMRQLGGDLPASGSRATDVVARLDEFGSPATIATTGGRFFGFVVGGALPAALGAHWLSDVWDQNACLNQLSPVAAYLEEVVLRWLLDLLGLPETCGGGFVTGAQMANFTGLAAARYSVLAKAGWEVNREGLFGAPPVKVVVGEEVHATLLKALALLGFGRDRVVVVPADHQGRMQSKHLSHVLSDKIPTIVCTQVGNVNSGACDPVKDICDAAKANGTWVHVDGAFGLWAAASPRLLHLVEGVSAADSWATDAHKWLNVPQDSGVVFVRDAHALHAAMSISAAYLNPGQMREPMQWVPESSRRARAVEIWAALQSLGRDGVAELIDRSCAHAQAFAAGLRSARYEVLNDVVLNQVVVAFGDDEKTDRVIRAIQTDGTCWCGGTHWKGRKAMRISVSSWATTEDDVTASLAAMLRIAANE